MNGRGQHGGGRGFPSSAVCLPSGQWLMQAPRTDTQQKLLTSTTQSMHVAIPPMHVAMHTLVTLVTPRTAPAQVGIEMKFKDCRYPVIIAPTHVPEMNEVRLHAARCAPLGAGAGGRR